MTTKQVGKQIGKQETAMDLLKLELKKDDEVIWKRIVQFINDNSSIKKKDYSYSGLPDIREVKELRCPCGIYKTSFFTDYKWLNHKLWHEFQLHLVHQIRLNGSIDHMKLFIKIFGKKIARMKFEEYARKSIIVAYNLKGMLEELKD